MKHVPSYVRRVITKNLRLESFVETPRFPRVRRGGGALHLRKREGGKGRGGVDFFGTPPVATRSHERACGFGGINRNRFLVTKRNGF